MVLRLLNHYKCTCLDLGFLLVLLRTLQQMTISLTFKTDYKLLSSHLNLQPSWFGKMRVQVHSFSSTFFFLIQFTCLSHFAIEEYMILVELFPTIIWEKLTYRFYCFIFVSRNLFTNHLHFNW